MDIHTPKKLVKINYKFDGKSIWLGLFLILAISFCFWLIAILNNASLFKIKDVRYNIVVEDNLRTWVNRYALGRRLCAIDIKAIHTQFSKAHPEYKAIYVIREFPSTLKIEIELRRPFAQLKARGFYCIDRQGIVITDEAAEPFRGLVAVELTERAVLLKRGSLIRDKRLNFAFNLIEMLKKHPFFKKLPLRFVNVISQDTAYFVVGETRVIVGTADIEHKLSVLQNLLRQQLGNDITSAEYIDLRYQKVYLGIKR